ncbi:SacI homology domain-containing protein [Radiomyces spectabilis]|uniref:SacI homology domain-containing protein n=1 Tax=Radiomyces spectabilis TaxID=64574 RepID=UPI00221FCCF1|nr:SacI homology domain-containing protein [Radiomyces spectabilis]KAI8391264.1 SacI homology domain-containing protein [Radiomyces spectabilis]
MTEQETVRDIYGILGFIRLLAGEYMIVITNCDCIGSIGGQDIYRISAFQILPLAQDLSELSELQAQDEQHYVTLLEYHLKSNSFFYSYNYDLTQNLQKQSQFSADTLSAPLWQRSDERFFWNRFISSKLIDLAKNMPQLNDFILPVMQGFVNLQMTSINQKSFLLGIITRRSRHRPGTRYFSRGIDDKGHVSNFVETEQLVLYDGPQGSQPMQGKVRLSYVQTRGSIPVYWTQVINLKYTPRLWVGESRRSLSAARAHFDEQIRIYGPQILVNLINKKGYELPMGQAYARVIEQLNDPRLHYTHFDFHNECKKMRWDRIQLLVDQLQNQLEEQSYFYLDTANEKPLKVQTSVCRSNCMDCLDRTNVVQSTFARWVLTRQLREVGILTEKDVVDNHESFMVIFRNVWADNANAVSTTYSGTGALKTDFTRTGQRTKSGALQDLQNSLTRYAKNNFMDGNRQDAFDLFLGNYQVEGGNATAKYHSPFGSNRPLRVRVVPYILLFALFMFWLNVFRPSYSGFQSTTSYMLLLAFWISVVISGVRFAIQHGDDFVQWPHLVALPPTELETSETGTVEKGHMAPPEGIPLQTL